MFPVARFCEGETVIARGPRPKGASEFRECTYVFYLTHRRTFCDYGQVIMVDVISSTLVYVSNVRDRTLRQWLFFVLGQVSAAAT